MNKKICFITFILGLICSFGQPPYNYIIPSLCSIALFLHFIKKSKNSKEAAWTSFSFGYGYFIYSHNWFSTSLLAYGDQLLWLYPFGLLLIPAFFAIYFSLMGFCIFKYSYGNIFITAMIWLAMELIRSFGYIELPWLLIGYVWSSSEIISQSVSLFGIYGLSFLTIIWAGSIKEIFPFVTKKNILFASLSFIACYSYGIQHLNSMTTQQKVNIRLIQSNIDQNIESRMNNRYENLIKSIDMSQNNNNIDYVIWPEGSIEYNLNTELLKLIKNAAPKNGTLIFSSNRIEQEPLKAWNSLFAINDQGEIIDYYDKIHLVPLGEFIPLRNIFPFINKITPGSMDYSRGKELRTVKTTHPFAPSICYEATFSEYPKQPYTWIVNITNDGWFGKSIGPKQHLAIAKFRSIEQGVPMARAATTGISAIIDSFGHIVKHAPLQTQAIIDAQLPNYISTLTYYRTYGNYMLSALVSLAFLLLYLLDFCRSRVR